MGQVQLSKVQEQATNSGILVILMLIALVRAGNLMAFVEPMTSLISNMNMTRDVVLHASLEKASKTPHHDHGCGR